MKNLFKKFHYVKIPESCDNIISSNERNAKFYAFDDDNGFYLGRFNYSINGLRKLFRILKRKGLRIDDAVYYKGHGLFLYAIQK